MVIYVITNSDLIKHHIDDLFSWHFLTLYSLFTWRAYFPFSNCHAY